MKVCLVSREYPPFFGGGIGTYNVQWARALAKGGHTAVVVTVSDDGTTGRETSNGVTVVRLPFLKGTDWSGPHRAIATPENIAAFRALSPVSVFARQVELAMPALVNEFGFDVIEVPDTGALAWFGLNSRRTGGAWAGCPPVVTTIHSPSAWIAEFNRQPQATRADHELVSMEYESAVWSDALISPSAALAEWTRRTWGLAPGRVEVIPYPLGDLQAARGEPRAGSGEFRLLFVGRQEPRKGIDTLFGALTRLQGLPVRLAVVGEDTPDPSRPGLFGENSIRDHASASSRVSFLGRKSPAELPAVRDGADAVVIPSPMDNFPYVCVEAMAEGRLVIASDTGGTGEMIRDGVDGFLFKAGDAESCARAIKAAAASSPEARGRMRASAAERIRAYCGNEAILDRRLSHYRRTIEKAKERRSVAAGRAFVCINRGAATPHSVGRLIEALQSSGDDFAHGWARTHSGVQAHSTPRVRTLSLSARILGPLVTTEEAIDRAGVRGLLRRSGEPGTAGDFVADSPWAVAMELCAAGCRGVCVPEVVEDVSSAELHPVDRALLEELKLIHESRGWRMLNRVYDLLHVVRGRGLRRPYHPVGHRRAR